MEGEDALAAATAQPVDVLRANVDVEPALLGEVGTAAHPARVIAVFRRSELPRWEERPATLALWRVSDPGNVGTLIRTADAFGAGVALSDGCADPTSPKALRASTGSIWRVPLGTWDDVHARRIALVAHGGEPLSSLDLTPPVAFLLGSERSGVPVALPRDADARIPISGAESLNVAAAGAIALYELERCASL